MPKPMTKNNYTKLVTPITEACTVVARKSMQDAVKEIKLNGKGDTVIDTSISCDGSWQQRGFSSLNGFVSLISMDSGKVIDVEAMSRYCKQCIYC